MSKPEWTAGLDRAPRGESVVTIRKSDHGQDCIEVWHTAFDAQLEPSDLVAPIAGDGEPPWMIINEKRWRYEWGGSGAGAEIVLDLAQSFASDAIILGLTLLGQRLKERLDAPVRIERERAIEVSKQTIAKNFEVSAFDLSLSGESSTLTGCEVSLSFVDTHGNHYETTVGPVGHLPMVTHVRRSVDPRSW